MQSVVLREDFQKYLTLNATDNAFTTAAKLGIKQGISFLFKDDLILQLLTYKKIIIVDFSNVIRNLSFLQSMMILGFNVVPYIDLERNVIPHEYFQDLLPMFIQLLQNFVDETTAFLIFIPDSLPNVIFNDNIGIIYTMCQDFNNVPCPIVFRRNETDDHAIFITYFLLKIFNKLKAGNTAINILSGDNYRWSEPYEDSESIVYHDLIQKLLLEKAFIYFNRLTTNESEKQQRYERLVFSDNYFWTETNNPFSINSVFLIY